MFRLAHISDVHLSPLPKPSFRQLASKRITGYINWQRNRKGKLGNSVLAKITGIPGKELSALGIPYGLHLLPGLIAYPLGWLLVVRPKNTAPIASALPTAIQVATGLRN